METFVRPDSIVRRIWGDGDMVLFVFAGSAAEFALNRAVDWLFFTGKLPGDPLGRLFSTATYAQHIVFASADTAAATLNRIRAIHTGVEDKRGQTIPDWAHRDVLYMLIDYSERAHRILARPLDRDEQNELYDVFHRVGLGLGIPDLPSSYSAWVVDRDVHMKRDLINSDGTVTLYAQYKKHLGRLRYRLLLNVQAILAPDHVRALLNLNRGTLFRRSLKIYPFLVRVGLRETIQRLLMPPAYLPAVRSLDLSKQPAP